MAHLSVVVDEHDSSSRQDLSFPARGEGHPSTFSPAIQRPGFIPMVRHAVGALFAARWTMFRTPNNAMVGYHRAIGIWTFTSSVEDDRMFRRWCGRLSICGRRRVVVPLVLPWRCRISSPRVELRMIPGVEPLGGCERMPHGAKNGERGEVNMASYRTAGVVRGQVNVWSVPGLVTGASFVANKKTDADVFHWHHHVVRGVIVRFTAITSASRGDRLSEGGRLSTFRRQPERMSTSFKQYGHLCARKNGPLDCALHDLLSNVADRAR